MEIKFLGTGGAFDYTYGTSSATVQTNEHFFLIDCGTSVFGSLMEHDLIDKIDYVAITHMHGDHVGCLFQLIAYLATYHQKIVRFVSVDPAFDQVITSFLDIHFVDRARYEFVPINDIPSIGCIDIKGQHVPDMPGYAFYFAEDDELIYFSGDMGRIETVLEFLETRQESNIRIFHETMHKDGIAGHVYYKEINEKLKDYETYLYHTTPEKMPDDNPTPLVASVPELNW